MPRKTPPKRPTPKDTREPTANRPPHPGEAERIAARRAQAFRLRVTGKSYRTIADHLGVSVHTAWDDVAAELNELRDLEIQRCDAMIVGLWRKVEAGDTKAVLAACRVMERRAKLLGLDASTKIDLGGKLAIDTGLTDAVRHELDRFAARHAGSGSLPPALDQ
jgi:hypothetical protein